MNDEKIYSSSVQSDTKCGEDLTYGEATCETYGRDLKQGRTNLKVEFGYEGEHISLASEKCCKYGQTVFKYSDDSECPESCEKYTCEAREKSECEMLGDYCFWSENECKSSGPCMDENAYKCFEFAEYRTPSLEICTDIRKCAKYTCNTGYDLSQEICESLGENCVWSEDEGECLNEGPCASEDAFECFKQLQDFLGDYRLLETFEEQCDDRDCEQCAYEIVKNDLCREIENDDIDFPRSCGMSPEKCAREVWDACAETTTTTIPTPAPTSKYTENGPTCVNWYGEEYTEWDSIGFERIGEDSGWAWTPDGCYQAHVGMYGNFDCHVLDTDGEYHSCNGTECVDGQCQDCNGVVNGETVYDACYVCGGDSSSCTDCEGTPNGYAYEDACGVCMGDSSSCADCFGVLNGNAVEDECGICGGDGTSCNTFESTTIPDTTTTTTNADTLLNCVSGFCNEYNNAQTTYLYDIPSLRECVDRLSVAEDRVFGENCAAYNPDNQICRLGKSINSFSPSPFQACELEDLSTTGIHTTSTTEPCMIVDCAPGCTNVDQDENGCGGSCECPTTTSSTSENCFVHINGVIQDHYSVLAIDRIDCYNQIAFGSLNCGTYCADFSQGTNFLDQVFGDNDRVTSEHCCKDGDHCSQGECITTSTTSLDETTTEADEYLEDWDATFAACPIWGIWANEHCSDGPGSCSGEPNEQDGAKICEEYNTVSECNARREAQQYLSDCSTTTTTSLYETTTESDEYLEASIEITCFGQDCGYDDSVSFCFKVISSEDEDVTCSSPNDKCCNGGDTWTFKTSNDLKCGSLSEEDTSVTCTLENGNFDSLSATNLYETTIQSTSDAYDTTNSYQTTTESDPYSDLPECTCHEGYDFHYTDVESHCMTISTNSLYSYCHPGECNDNEVRCVEQRQTTDAYQTTGIYDNSGDWESEDPLELYGNSFCEHFSLESVGLSIEDCKARCEDDVSCSAFQNDMRHGSTGYCLLCKDCYREDCNYMGSSASQYITYFKPDDSYSTTSQATSDSYDTTNSYQTTTTESDPYFDLPECVCHEGYDFDYSNAETHCMSTSSLYPYCHPGECGEDQIRCVKPRQTTDSYGTTDPYETSSSTVPTPSTTSITPTAPTASTTSIDYPHVCTKDAMMCPDGSYVGRDVENNCEFYPCPPDNHECDQYLCEAEKEEECVNLGEYCSWTGYGCINSGPCVDEKAYDCFEASEYRDLPASYPVCEDINSCRKYTCGFPFPIVNEESCVALGEYCEWNGRECVNSGPCVSEAAHDCFHRMNDYGYEIRVSNDYSSCCNHCADDIVDQLLCPEIKLEVENYSIYPESCGYNPSICEREINQVCNRKECDKYLCVARDEDLYKEMGDFCEWDEYHGCRSQGPCVDQLAFDCFDQYAFDTYDRDTYDSYGIPRSYDFCDTYTTSVEPDEDCACVSSGYGESRCDRDNNFTEDECKEFPEEYNCEWKCRSDDRYECGKYLCVARTEEACVEYGEFCEWSEYEGCRSLGACVNQSAFDCFDQYAMDTYDRETYESYDIPRSYEDCDTYTTSEEPYEDCACVSSEYGESRCDRDNNFTEDECKNFPENYNCKWQCASGNKYHVQNYYDHLEERDVTQHSASDMGIESRHRL
jgi:hypothetical protein